MAKSTYLLIITLNENGLNVPIKKHAVSEWIKKRKTHVYTAIRDLHQILRHTQTEREGMGKDIPCKWK